MFTVLRHDILILNFYIWLQRLLVFYYLLFKPSNSLPLWLALSLELTAKFWVVISDTKRSPCFRLNEHFVSNFKVYTRKVSLILPFTLKSTKLLLFWNLLGLEQKCLKPFRKRLKPTGRLLSTPASPTLTRPATVTRTTWVRAFVILSVP